MARYDIVMREKCRQAALAQHRNMSTEQKKEMIDKIKKGRAKAVADGKRPGHFIPHTDRTKQLLSIVKKGTQAMDKNPNWKGGVSYLASYERGTAEYKRWRKEVFKRDNYTCQKCGTHGGFLHAHHITQFSEDRENYSLTNGLTLCVHCHESIHGFKFGTGLRKNKQSLSNTIANSKEMEENKYGGMAARQISNSLESIGVKNVNPEMETRAEGYSKNNQAQRIGSEKIQSSQETPTTQVVENIC